MTVIRPLADTISTKMLNTQVIHITAAAFSLSYRLMT